MKSTIRFKTTTPLLLIALVLLCFALSPQAPAVVPPPDGGYANFTTAEGQNALFSLTTGSANTAVGWFSLFSDVEGGFNTAIGAGALALNTGGSNTGIGAAALILNTGGERNTAVGTAAMVNNNVGNDNTAVGDHALTSQTAEGPNTAVGSGALFNNTLGDANTANGTFALFSNTEGSSNTASGHRALFSNTGGSGNTANGFTALQNNTIGGFNTAIGLQALQNNETGSANTAVGNQALFANTNGSNNTAVGASAGALVTTADNIICIGSLGANVSDSCFIANIRDVTTHNADAIAVVIDSAGQLGTMSSSARFKKEIKPMNTASEAVLALKPVTFHYRSDKKETLQFGLIAEEVAKVNPDLVVRDKNGEVYTVRYDAVNAMLLNEFLKEHRKVGEQEATITQLKKDFGATVAQLTARLDEQAAQIQKVSGQLEASKPAPQIVNNP